MLNAKVKVRNNGVLREKTFPVPFISLPAGAIARLTASDPSGKLLVEGAKLQLDVDYEPGAARAASPVGAGGAR